MENKHKIHYHEWKAFKKYFGLHNASIGAILGINPRSVQNSTAPSYQGSFPIWAKLAIWVWKKSLEKEVLAKAELIREINELKKNN